ncbi:MAG: succinate dehydrogenase, hydrophobic membrane anchor protein [Rhodospirillaceae bacterium]|nr:succinate dehydrogenase, hydrophobic membrane anchor protein [Rhodospirillaceae bacterium]
MATSPQTSLRSPLGRVRGLGSAKEGTHHWWAQRVTAVALIPITAWIVYSLLSLAGGDYIDYLGWVRNPVNSTLIILLVAVGFHHAQLGLQVVIEDYVSGHALRVVSVLAVKLLCAALAALCIVSVLIVAFGG